MKILKRTLLIVFVVIAVIVLSGFMYVRHLSQRAVPDYNMDLKLKGLNGPVEVYRDQYAVPHIYASDEHDLYMVTGYLLAEDRLWQMDLLRRVTEGRLSEVLTDEYVDTDLLLRALRFSEKSEKILQDADSIDRIALESFSEGVNQYIKGHGNKLPPEFAILGYKPDNWEPVHSVNMIGYMAWDLKAGWSEILLAEIQKAVDSARYADILPNLARKSSLVYPDFKLNSRKSAFLPDMLLNNALLRGLGADVFDASNNWAVSGGKSVSGKPLFANDMHLGLNIPGIWYQMHQCVPGKLNVTGVMLTNTPYVICGLGDDKHICG
jgi:penicillin amidase